MSGQIRIERLRTEEELQMELQRRALRTLDHEELLAFADQLLWAQWHRERVVKGLADRVLELEMEVSCLDGGGGGAAVTPEHLQWARDLHQAE
jgi:hypothetical protein